MADEQTNSPGDAAPPKIKLNLASAGIPPRESKPAVPIRPADKKTETTRIDLSMAMPPPAAASVGDTQPVAPEQPPVAKRSTVRIDVPIAAKVETQKVKTETQSVGRRALNDTMRVEVAETKKTETTRISIPEEAFKKTPGAPPGPRMPMPAGSEDVFKRTTIPVGIPTPPPPTPTAPKTIALKRPAAVAEPTPTERAVSEAKKSETARIDLPADGGSERPTTRPKTIRIKRPDGTTARKALTIARPDPSVSQGPSTISVEGDEEESAGTAFSVLALVATLIACVLIYVLAAQTIAPELPFPGRI
ncbi:MAG TPA: hypothetical protein PKE12_06540 [Kiritimatiellia bacterium]|nr:hypothetical protein [Kiritimatiellia bacterium]